MFQETLNVNICANIFYVITKLKIIKIGFDETEINKVKNVSMELFALKCLIIWFELKFIFLPRYRQRFFNNHKAARCINNSINRDKSFGQKFNFNGNQSVNHLQIGALKFNMCLRFSPPTPWDAVITD